MSLEDPRRTLRAARGARWAALAGALALALAMAGCDRCGDFFWEKQPGACKAGPPAG